MVSVGCRRLEYLRLGGTIYAYETWFDFAAWLLIERLWANHPVGQTGGMNGIKLICWRNCSRFLSITCHIFENKRYLLLKKRVMETEHSSLTPLPFYSTYVQYKALLNRPKKKWMKARRKINEMSSAELRDLQIRDELEVIYCGKACNHTRL